MFRLLALAWRIVANIALPVAWPAVAVATAGPSRLVPIEAPRFLEDVPNDDVVPGVM